MVVMLLLAALLEQLLLRLLLSTSEVNCTVAVGAAVIGTGSVWYSLL